MRLFLPYVLLCSSLCAASTTVLFGPTSTTTGPFPSNALTLTDNTQQTGLTIQLPATNNCIPGSAQSVCGDAPTLGLLNHLDGFSVNPRVMVCFSGPVQTSTLQSGINLVPVVGGAAISINQVIYDPNSNCAFAKPNQVLAQQSQYLLVVSGTIQDASGKPVVSDPAFLSCLASSSGYCRTLVNASAATASSLHPLHPVALSLFTTMSATAWMNKVYGFVSANPLGPATILGGAALSGLTNITWVPGGTTAPPQNIPLTVLTGVGSLEVGLFSSYDFLDPANGSIDPTPTTSSPAPYAVFPVSFHVFLPAGSKPQNGYPVVIYGHGLGDNQFGAPSYIASTLAQKGFATLGFEITGHGYGQSSVLNLTAMSGGVQTVPTPGRGIQLGPNLPIGPTDGCILPGALAVRDCGRQTAVDLFALVQAIQNTPSLNLDASKIYYVGQSFGGTYGTLFNALEPDVNAAVLNGDGGPSTDVARLAISGRPLGFEYLAPLGLLNVPPASPDPYFGTTFGYGFNDNYVFRDVALVVNKVPGAMPIQAAFEAAEWLGMLGDPLGFAGHLTKPVLFQFGLGDLEVPNPTESAVVRAAGAQASTWYFRFDLAAVAYGHPELLALTTPDAAPLPILPHRILSNPSIFSVASETSLALAEQQQVAAYFLSNGTTNPDPNLFVTPPFSPSMRLFQIPKTLPTQLNFVQFPPSPAVLPASSTSCDGIYNGTFQGNITVASGQNCVFLSGGISGNVAASGGTLVLSGATVQGNLQVTGNSTVSLQSSTVNGNVAIQNISAGTPSLICGTKVNGNLTYQNNTTAMQIGAAGFCAANTIGGNLQVQNNTGATVIYGNAISGNLQCQNNTALSGSANTAKQKQGQCALF